MQWTNQINRVAGITLLLLALGIILSIVFSVSVTDADPFERDEVGDFLQDIDDNRTLAILGIVADIATDAVIGIAAAAMVYLVFRDRNRLLALGSSLLLLSGQIAFLAGDAGNISLIILAEDFVDKGGAGEIAAGSDVILETARAAAIWTLVADQTAITAIGAGLISLGALIAWAPAGAGPVPPRWLGGLALVAGLFSIVSWIGAVSTDAGLALAVIGGVATVVFLISVGIWLVREPEAG